MMDASGVNDILRRQAADRLHGAFGTVGRPSVVATTQDEHGNMVLVYADGCLARRVPAAFDSGDNGWQWEALEGPDYDLLFVTEAGKVGVWTPRPSDVWLCACKGNMAKNSRHEDRCPDCGYTRPADD